MADKMWKHPLYGRWKAMHNSAYSEHADEWRQIPDSYVPEVCERWRGVSCDDPGFANFIEDMGLPPFAGAVLLRKDLRKDWSKENLEWATRGKVWNRNNSESIGWRNYLPENKAEAIEDILQARALKVARETKI
jgi:hypothetical protein